MIAKTLRETLLVRITTQRLAVSYLSQFADIQKNISDAARSSRLPSQDGLKDDASTSAVRAPQKRYHAPMLSGLERIRERCWHFAAVSREQARCQDVRDPLERLRPPIGTLVHCDCSAVLARQSPIILEPRLDRAPHRDDFRGVGSRWSSMASAAATADTQESRQRTEHQVLAAINCRSSRYHARGVA